MEKTQREYYLNEQMKAIQKELADGEDGGNELDELESALAELKMPKAARKADAEMKKLRNMSPMSAEATVVPYLDWMLAVPWKKASRLQKTSNRPVKSSMPIILVWKRSRIGLLSSWRFSSEQNQ